jgi:hypothetical protein
MKAALQDRIYLVPIAQQSFAREREMSAEMQLVDVEFSEKYRSRRLPAGWFLLPCAAIALAFVAAAIL